MVCYPSSIRHQGSAPHLQRHLFACWYLDTEIQEGIKAVTVMKAVAAGDSALQEAAKHIVHKAVVPAAGICLSFCCLLCLGAFAQEFLVLRSALDAIGFSLQQQTGHHECF